MQFLDLCNEIESIIILEDIYHVVYINCINKPFVLVKMLNKKRHALTGSSINYGC